MILAVNDLVRLLVNIVLPSTLRELVERVLVENLHGLVNFLGGGTHLNDLGEKKVVIISRHPILSATRTSKVRATVGIWTGGENKLANGSLTTGYPHVKLCCPSIQAQPETGLLPYGPTPNV